MLHTLANFKRMETIKLSKYLFKFIRLNKFIRRDSKVGNRKCLEMGNAGYFRELLIRVECKYAFTYCFPYFPVILADICDMTRLVLKVNGEKRNSNIGRIGQWGEEWTNWANEE